MWKLRYLTVFCAFTLIMGCDDLDLNPSANTASGEKASSANALDAPQAELEPEESVSQRIEGPALGDAQALPGVVGSHDHDHDHGEASSSGAYYKCDWCGALTSDTHQSGCPNHGKGGSDDTGAGIAADDHGVATDTEVCPAGKVCEPDLDKDVPGQGACPSKTCYACSGWSDTSDGCAFVLKCEGGGHTASYHTDQTLWCSDGTHGTYGGHGESVGHVIEGVNGTDVAL